MAAIATTPERKLRGRVRGLLDDARIGFRIRRRGTSPSEKRIFVSVPETAMKPYTYII